jgi:8-oxo-dGTP pyrophosphatase MutT (NUDIX family)
MKNFYYFLISGYGEAVFGYVRQSVVDGIPWPEAYWTLDPSRRTLTLLATDFDTRSAYVQQTLRLGFEAGKVPYPRGWTDELCAVKTRHGNHVLSMDESGADLFGISCEAVCLTAWTNTELGRRYWVQRRAMTRRTSPGLFDNTAMGSLREREEPFEGMVRETLEEAGLPEEYLRNNVKNCGTVSYHLTVLDDKTVGSLPHVQYVYELELPADIKPAPVDGEVDSFELLSAEEVMQALRERKFKPNMGATWLDHFCRHKFLTPETEPNYDEIWSRVHRKHEMFIC